MEQHQITYNTERLQGPPGQSIKLGASRLIRLWSCLVPAIQAEKLQVVQSKVELEMSCDINSSMPHLKPILLFCSRAFACSQFAPAAVVIYC